HAALGASIHIVVLLAAQAITRGNIDDLAALPANHMRDHCARTVKLTGQVDVDAPAPFGVGDLIERLTKLVLTPTSVVDQHVDPAEFVKGSRDHCIDLLRNRDIGGLYKATPTKFLYALGGLFQLRDRARGGDHICTTGGQPQGHCAAEPPSGASDDCHLAVQIKAVENHRISP